MTRLRNLTAAEIALSAGALVFAVIVIITGALHSN